MFLRKRRKLNLQYSKKPSFMQWGDILKQFSLFLFHAFIHSFSNNKFHAKTSRSDVASATIPQTRISANGPTACQLAEKNAPPKILRRSPNSNKCVLVVEEGCGIRKIRKIFLTNRIPQFCDKQRRITILKKRENIYLKK